MNICYYKFVQTHKCKYWEWTIVSSMELGWLWGGTIGLSLLIRIIIIITSIMMMMMIKKIHLWWMTLMMGEVLCLCRAWCTWKSLYFSLNFVVSLILFLEIKSKNQIKDVDNLPYLGIAIMKVIIIRTQFFFLIQVGECLNFKLENLITKKYLLLDLSYY